MGDSLEGVLGVLTRRPRNDPITATKSSNAEKRKRESEKYRFNKK